MTNLKCPNWTDASSLLFIRQCVPVDGRVGSENLGFQVKACVVNKEKNFISQLHVTWCWATQIPASIYIDERVPSIRKLLSLQRNPLYEFTSAIMENEMIPFRPELLVVVQGASVDRGRGSARDRKKAGPRASWRRVCAVTRTTRVNLRLQLGHPGGCHGSDRHQPLTSLLFPSPRHIDVNVKVTHASAQRPLPRVLFHVNLHFTLQLLVLAVSIFAIRIRIFSECHAYAIFVYT